MAAQVKVKKHCFEVYQDAGTVTIYFVSLIGENGVGRQE